MATDRTEVLELDRVFDPLGDDPEAERPGQVDERQKQAGPPLVAKHLMLSLEFPSPKEAKMFRSALQPVWEASGAGQAWVLHEDEAVT